MAVIRQAHHEGLANPKKLAGEFEKKFFCSFNHKQASHIILYVMVVYFHLYIFNGIAHFGFLTAMSFCFTYFSRY